MVILLLLQPPTLLLQEKVNGKYFYIALLITIPLLFEIGKTFDLWYKKNCRNKIRERFFKLSVIMEETDECKGYIPCEGATASENVTFNKPVEEERELYSKLSVDKAKKLKSSKLSLKIDAFKSPESSDLIKPLEEMNLFELQSLRTTDLVETSKMSEESVRPEFSKPSARSKASEQSVRPKVSEQSVRPKISEQCVKPEVSKQSLKSRLSEPLVRPEVSKQPLKLRVSEPSVRPKLSKSLFKSKIFKPFLKNKLTISEPSESLETFELSEPSEKFKLSETLAESKMIETCVESKLSDSTEELKLPKPPTKYKFSKLFTSKIFKPFTKNKLSISEPANLYESSNLSEAAGKIKLLESPVLSESGVKTKFKSPVKPKLLESAMPSKNTTTPSGTKESTFQIYESNKTLDHFLELRRSYMIVLYKETMKVKTFIDEVEKFKPPYRSKYVKNVEMLYASDASDWANLHAYWDSFKNHITELIQVIKEIYIDSKKPISLTIEEFQDLIELLIYVFIDMRELCEICQNGLDKYRRLCFYYNEYLFLVYASTFNSLVSPLREKMRIELNEFKIIEEEVLGLK